MKGIETSAGSLRLSVSPSLLTTNGVGKSETLLTPQEAISLTTCTQNNCMRHLTHKKQTGLKYLVVTITIIIGERARHLQG